MKYKTRIEHLIVYDVYRNGIFICNGTMKEIANHLNIKRKVAVKYKREGYYKFYERGIITPEKEALIKYKDEHYKIPKDNKRLNNKREYAIYENDDFLTIGTLNEICEWLGITYETLLTYKSKGIKYIFVEV